ncbi:hypothetical protein D3C76_1158680 [compost metagenome]
MATDSALESMPIDLNAFACAAVADEPLVMASMKFLMPVAATSCLTPVASMVAPNAAICPDAKPATAPKGPIAVTMLEISPVLAP